MRPSGVSMRPSNCRESENAPIDGKPSVSATAADSAATTLCGTVSSSPSNRTSPELDEAAQAPRRRFAEMIPPGVEGNAARRAQELLLSEPNMEAIGGDDVGKAKGHGRTS